MKLNRNNLRKMILSELKKLNESSSAYEFEKENIRQMMRSKNTVRFKDGLIKFHMAYDSSGSPRGFVRILEADDRSTSRPGQVFQCSLTLSEIEEKANSGFFLDNLTQNPLFCSTQSQEFQQRAFRAFVRNPY